MEFTKNLSSDWLLFGEKNSNDWLVMRRNKERVNIVVEKNKGKTKDPSSVWSGRIKRKEYVSGCTALHVCTTISVLGGFRAQANVGGTHHHLHFQISTNTHPYLLTPLIQILIR